MHANVESEPGKMNSNGAAVNHSVLVSKLSDDRADREPAHGDARSRLSSKTDAGVVDVETNIDGDKVLDGSDTSASKNGVGEMADVKAELPVESFYAKKLTEDSQGREIRNKAENNDRRETRRSSSGMDRTNEKGDKNSRRHDEMYAKKERTDDQNGSKERMKDEGHRSGEKAKGSDSRKSSTRLSVKDDRKETERARRTSTKNDDDRKSRRTNNEKGERSRRTPSDSSRHKRHRSCSVSSKGRNSKDNSVVSHAYDSTDLSSDDSKRKLHSKRRNLSPSSVRSKRRQVLRSPHSKHSQRRHSPYPSIENSRGRRSRSRSPVRRQR
ncbi:unnamed protein product [Ilex paraguariensis]|uniref:Uncharacterized protein n=1 Tax=Ilex paraguariensis TaxID=185542 RepID=A0ABC8U4F3_9AQUA